MTEKLYYHDSTLLEFESEIIDCGKVEDKYFTVLDKSAFYPTSGGQFHDTGKLNFINIVDVLDHDDRTVRHISTQPVGEIGDKVNGTINADRRFRHCRQHTAQHILSRVFTNLFGFMTESVHLGEEYGAVEINCKDITTEQLSSAEDVANKIIASNLPIDILFVEPEDAKKLPLRKFPEISGKMRIIKIGDLEYAACGGTHCNHTSEVLMLKIIGIEKIRGRVSVQFLSGKQVYDDYRARFEITSELTRKLTCHLSDLPTRYEKLESDHRNIKKELNRFQKDLLPKLAEKISKELKQVGKTNLVYKALESFDHKLAGQLAAIISESINGLVVLKINSKFVLSVSDNSNLDAGKIARAIIEKTGLKGGGSRKNAQLSNEMESSLDIINIIRDILSNE